MVWWTVLSSLGLLTGGLYWRLVLYDRTDFDDDETLHIVTDRWRGLETIAIGVLGASGVASFAVTSDYFPTEIGTAVLGAIPLAFVLWLWIGRTGDEERGDGIISPRSIRFVVTLGMLCGLAWLETRTGTLDWVVRVGHLGSFALWIGGAA